MIDIVRDYASIGIGTAQATTARTVGTGRAGVARIGSLAQVDRAALGSALAGLVPAAAIGRARETGALGIDVDQVISRLGLVKTSELNAVRHQLQRIERRLGEVRGER